MKRMITLRPLSLLAVAVTACCPLGPLSAQPNPDPVVLFHDGFENSEAGPPALAMPPFSTLEIPGTMSLGAAFTLAIHVDNREVPADFTRLFSSYRGSGGVMADRLILDMDPRGTSITGIRAIINNVVTVTPSPPAGMNNPGYHHYAVTYDDGQVTIYFNGTAVASGIAGSGPVAMTQDLRVGEDPHDTGGTANEQLIGYVDNVLVLGRALSAAEIQALVTQSAIGLVTPAEGELAVYYDFEGDSGETITDKFAGDGAQDGVVHRRVSAVTDSALARLGQGALWIQTVNTPPPGATDPEVGSYAAASTFVQVLDGPVDGGPAGAYAGEQYAMIDRTKGGTPTLSALFEGGALAANSAKLDIEFHLWVADVPNNGAVAGLSRGTAIDGATQLLWNGFGQLDAWGTEGWDFLGWRYYDGQWHGPGTPLVSEAWNKIQIHWDGLKATGKVNDGDPMPIGRFGSPGNLVDRVFFSTLIAGTVYYLDEITVVATPFPELPAIVTSGSENPTGNGFVLDAEGTTATGPGDDGVAHWQIEAAANGRAAYQAAVAQDYFAAPAGWTATAMVRLVDGAPADAELTVVDSESVWSLQLSSGATGLPERGLYLRTSSGLQRLDSADTPVAPSDYNTCQMIFDPIADEERGGVRVYVNGFNLTAQPITRAEVPEAGALSPQVRFGDNSTASGSASATRWAEVRFETGVHPAARSPIPPSVRWQVFGDDFEAGAVGVVPGPAQVGSYLATGTAAVVTDTDQPPARSGTQHLYLNRPASGTRLDFVYPLFTSTATAANRDRIHVEAWIYWEAGLPQFMMHNGTATIFYQVTFWGVADGYKITVYDGTSHIDTGLFHTPGQWMKFEVEYVLGGDQVVVRTADGVGAVRVPPVTTIQGVHSRSGGGGTVYYLDDIRAWLSSVPEPAFVETSGNDDPTASGFELVADGVPTVGSGEDDEKYWRIGTSTSQQAHYALPLLLDHLMDPRGWTATARGRVVSQSSTSDAQITVYDGQSIWSIRLSVGGGGLPPAGVYILTPGGETRLDTALPVNPAQYNTYQMLFDPLAGGGEGGVRVYVNGINLTPAPLLRSEVPDGTGAAPRFLFGDAFSSGSGLAETRWSVVRYETGLLPVLPLVLFRDGFENSPVAGPPNADDPEVGTYVSTSFFVEVMTGPFAGGPDAAYAGNNYLAIDRLASGGTPTLSALFGSRQFRAGETGLDIEFYLWTPGGDNNVAAVGLARGATFNNTTQLLWNGIGKLAAWDTAGWDFVGWRAYDGVWNGPGLAVPPNQWNKFNLEWNGTTARGRVNDGEWMAIPSFGTPDNIIDRLFFGTAIASTVYYLDDITVRTVPLQPVIEAPLLEFMRDGNTLVLSWSAPGFVLQQNPDATNPAGWTDVPNGQSSPVSVTIGPANLFFRLVQP
ncbi:MAG: LamG domain-containing protein [Verrucomicrobiae bacterium]|nr:LamG domain-containing protein [Verrucomicrobiae bacterium]